MEKHSILKIILFLFVFYAQAQGQSELKLIATFKEIPGLKDQPTEEGKVIRVLYPFRDKIYMGYGDGGANTGPIKIVSYNPVTTHFDTCYTSPTDNIDKFLTFQNDLFVPNNDPTGHLGGLFRFDSNEKMWDTTTNIPGAAHVYDVVEFQNKLFASTGSFTDEEPACIASTTDKGTTWKIEHETPSRDFDSTIVFSRYYYLGATSKFLFTMGMHHHVSKAKNQFIKHETFAWLYHDDKWIELKPELSWYQQPIVLNDSMVAVRKVGGHIYKDMSTIVGDSLKKINGLLPGEGIHSFFVNKTVSPEKLYAVIQVDSTQTAIFTTEDYSDWSKLAQIPSLEEGDSYASIAVLDSTIFIGTRKGSFYQLKIIKD